MKNETIVDRVVERLKAQPLGDLITEEDLHDIVKEAIPKVFFEKRREERRRSGGYSSDWVDLDPLIVEIMRDLLKDNAKVLVGCWLLENSEQVFAHWKSVIDAGLLTYVQQIQNEIATAQLKGLLAQLLKPVNDERMKQGLPMIFL